jgi:hypothetical protein
MFIPKGSRRDKLEKIGAYLATGIIILLFGFIASVVDGAISGDSDISVEQPMDNWGSTLDDGIPESDPVKQTPPQEKIYTAAELLEEQHITKGALWLLAGHGLGLHDQPIEAQNLYQWFVDNGIGYDRTDRTHSLKGHIPSATTRLVAFQPNFRPDDKREFVLVILIKDDHLFNVVITDKETNWQIACTPPINRPVPANQTELQRYAEYAYTGYSTLKWSFKDGFSSVCAQTPPRK